MPLFEKNKPIFSSQVIYIYFFIYKIHVYIANGDQFIANTLFQKKDFMTTFFGQRLTNSRLQGYEKGIVYY